MLVNLSHYHDIVNMIFILTYGNYIVISNSTKEAK